MTVPVQVYTRLFGVLSLPFTIHVVSHSGEGTRVAWSRSIAFPGLAPGETLGRRTTLPQRATLLARDGSVLAEGPPGPAVAAPGSEQSRNSPLGEAATAVVGSVGSVPAARRATLDAQGVPGDALVGLSRLERALDDRLRGTPGGELLAGSRVLAVTASRQSGAVRTTISPPLQKAAVAALGGQLGGIVVMQPTTGQILAVAGIGLDGLQPPGSTFKMVTLTGALAAHVADPQTVFPYATYAVLDGVRLNNANGEECGGTLEHAFAVSCNSVFTPLGVKLGSARLVQTAEAFGFNHGPGCARSSRKHASGSIPDQRRTGHRLDGDRPGRGRGHPAPDGDRGRDDRGRRPAAARDVHARARRVRHARHERLGCAHRAAADDRRGALGHGHRRGDPGRGRRGQDGHGRTEERLLLGRRLRTKRRIRHRKAASRKAIRATPTLGSPRSPRPCTRGSRCA